MNLADHSLARRLKPNHLTLVEFLKEGAKKHSNPSLPYGLQKKIQIYMPNTRVYY